MGAVYGALVIVALVVAALLTFEIVRTVWREAKS